MASTKPKTATGTKRSKNSRPELTEDEQRQLLEHAIQTQQRRAETQLELAKLFLAKGKPDIALRRLQELMAEFPGTAAAKAARTLVKRWA